MSNITVEARPESSVRFTGGAHCMYARSMESMTLGERLRYLRTQRGLSQDDLARLAVISKQHIFYIETGRRHNPTPPTLKALADGLNAANREGDPPVTPWILLHGRDLPEPGDALPSFQLYLRDRGIRDARIARYFTEMFEYAVGLALERQAREEGESNDATGRG